MFLSVLSVSSAKSAPAPYVSSGVQTNYMKEEIQSLASSCPFVEGTAVYRARPIHSYWEPNAVFDDRLLCIQGQNKNQDNTNIDIDSLIEGQIKTQNVPITQNNTQSNTPAKLHTGSNAIKLYPNPATNIITVEYHEKIDGELQITNNIGQVILQTQLGADNTKVQIPLENVAVGLYYYKIQFGEKVLNGKLNIIE